MRAGGKRKTCQPDWLDDYLSQTGANMREEAICATKGSGWETKTSESKALSQIPSE